MVAAADTGAAAAAAGVLAALAKPRVSRTEQAAALGSFNNSDDSWWQV